MTKDGKLLEKSIRPMKNDERATKKRRRTLNKTAASTASPLPRVRST